MFTVTVINFLLFSLTVGIETVMIAVLIRKALILDIEYPQLEKPKLVNDALQNLNIVSYWTQYLPVSSNPSLLDYVSIHTG